jgi:maltooligosyltrehalose trehalohydrolase
MGEEYGERNPFRYFTDHVDPFFAEATREGRKREFAAFAGFEGELPDPQAEEAFLRSKLTRRENDGMRSLYRRLLELRRDLPRETHAEVDGQLLRVRRGHAELEVDFAARTWELRT